LARGEKRKRIPCGGNPELLYIYTPHLLYAGREYYMESLNTKFHIERNISEEEEYI
jgi:hypothetical protein